MDPTIAAGWWQGHGYEARPRDKIVTCQMGQHWDAPSDLCSASGRRYAVVNALVEHLPNPAQGQNGDVGGDRHRLVPDLIDRIAGKSLQLGAVSPVTEERHGV